MHSVSLWMRELGSNAPGLSTKGCDQGVKADPGRPADPTHG
jgi:hypothetical protein